MSATLDPGQSAGSPPATPTERSRGPRRGLNCRHDALATDRRQASVGAPRPTAGSSAPKTDAAARQTTASAVASIRRRLLAALVLAAATVTLVLAVPPLRGTARQIDAMNPIWVVVAVAFELGSCVGYIVIFRRFFDQVPPGPARELARTEEASGALLPTGGVGALAIGGWLVRQADMSTRQIVERSTALFFFTSAANVAALVGGGAMLASGKLGGTDTVALAGFPIVVGAASTGLTLAIPILVKRMPGRFQPTWLVDTAAGIHGALHALLHPNWRLAGAVAYLGCDIAALGAAFAATGHAIPVDVLVLGYVIGYVANMLPVPGGFGALEAGLAGTLILYGAPATQAAAAVVVYHAIAFWVPSVGGLIGYARLRRRATRDATQPWAESTGVSTRSPA